MTELIKTREDLISYLTTKKIASKNPPQSVIVTTKLRRLIMTDENQGRFIHKGMHMRFGFESLGGGVYKAFIAKPLK